MKIRDVVENVSTEYTKKWIWRQPKEENVDILGRDSYTHRDVLNDPNNPKTRMATLEEYKAAKRS